MKKVLKLTTLVLGLLIGFPALSQESTGTEDGGSDAGCYDANVLSGKLISDFCWKCIFPIRVMGIPISTGEGRVPSGAASSPICVCPGKFGYPSPGIVMSMWEPARMIEFQRVPGCLGALGGSRLSFDRTFQGTHGVPQKDSKQKAFLHYHYYAFPLFIIMDMFTSSVCSGDGNMDLDIMYLSELDSTWNNDELAYFTNPEASAVANPAAQAACAADAVASTAGNPIASMFWCAGSWGGLYPLSGHVTGGAGVVKKTSLMKSKVLAALHRRGLALKTMGESALCSDHIEMVLPKTQYKFTLLHPIPETSRAHVMGESTLRWGMSRTIPGVGQDLIYTIWRWQDCCSTFY